MKPFGHNLKTFVAAGLAFTLWGCSHAAPAGTFGTTTSLTGTASTSSTDAGALGVTPAVVAARVAGEMAPAVALLTELPTVTRTFTAPMRPRREIAPTASGNEAILSVSPAETLPAVEQFISGAKHSLWIEMFELGGTYGEKVVPLLLERARAGVDVRLLLDGIGSGSQAKGIKPWAAQLAAAGVMIKFYPARLRDDRHGEHRFNITHRKLLLADSERALEGGTNLGTDFDTTEQDLMVRWRGPVVGDLYREFGIEWAFIGAGPLPVPQGPFAPAGIVDAQVSVTSTPEGRFEIQQSVFKAIDDAEREIIIEQQYLWDDALKGHLLGALHRGVKLRLIVPGGTKEKYTLWSLNMTAVHELTMAGAEARGFYNTLAPEAHLHTKYFSVDDRWVTAGSANGDERSFADHQELNVISTEPGFVHEMRERVFEQDWQHASKPFVYEALHFWTKPSQSLLDLVAYYF